MLEMIFDSWNKKTGCPIFTRIDCCGATWLETEKDPNGNWYYNDGRFVLFILAKETRTGSYLVKIKEEGGIRGQFTRHTTFWKPPRDIKIKESTWSD